MMQVEVRGELEEAIRSFKRIVQNSGLMKELKLRSHFESNGQRLKRKRAVNLRRLRKREQREGKGGTNKL